jgi:uncharacterized protein (DUF1330 family)
LGLHTVGRRDLVEAPMPWCDAWNGRPHTIAAMTAYFIADVAWKDDAAREQYVGSFGATLRPYGGRILVAGPAEHVEGDWHPARIVVLEFEDVEHAHAWYNSAEYNGVKTFRHQGADSSMVLVTAAFSG